MCEAKPGPRCTPHAAQAYATAASNYDGDPVATEPSPLDRTASGQRADDVVSWDRPGHATTADGYAVHTSQVGDGTNMRVQITRPSGEVFTDIQCPADKVEWAVDRFINTDRNRSTTEAPPVPAKRRRPCGNAADSDKKSTETWAWEADEGDTLIVNGGHEYPIVTMRELPNDGRSGRQVEYILDTGNGQRTSVRYGINERIRLKGAKERKTLPRFKD